MSRFNSKQFVRVITYILEKGVCCGKSISSRKEFYNVISEQLHFSAESVRSWTRPSSKGPDSGTLARLAECLEISPENFFCNSDCSSNSIESEKEIFKMNDFIRNKVYELNREIIYYFSKIDISDEGKFCELSLKIRALCLALPQEAALAIESYVAETLEPFIYDETSDLGIYCSKVLQAEKQWDEIAQRELKPLLFS